MGNDTVSWDDRLVRYCYYNVHCICELCMELGTCLKELELSRCNCRGRRDDLARTIARVVCVKTTIKEDIDTGVIKRRWPSRIRKDTSSRLGIRAYHSPTVKARSSKGELTCIQSKKKQQQYQYDLLITSAGYITKR